MPDAALLARLRSRGRGPSASAVAAGVVDVGFLTTVITLHQLPAQRLGPAMDQIVHGSPMARPQVLPLPVQGLTPIAPQDVRHLRHGLGSSPLSDRPGGR